ncbi:MAG: hypothetical protein V3R85_10840 [Alphaproteobacteria bacterium]
MVDGSVFGVLRRARRVWAIGSIHGDAARAQTIHEEIADRLKPGDRVVYLGNMMGPGPLVRETLDAIIDFRRAFLARPNTFIHDLVFLRGAQEEMWQRLMQLQFAVGPPEVLQWMLDHGIGPTIEAYGGNVDQALSAARQGPVAITRWTGELRDAFQATPGHQDWLSALRRAAYTDTGAVLLVSRGIAPDRPLDAQGDTFWWGARGFDEIKAPYGEFAKVVRGFDPEHRGAVTTDYTISLDGGSGFGGVLLAGCIAADGSLVEIIEG